MYSYTVYSTRVWETVLSGGFIPAHPGPLGTEAVHNEDWVYSIQCTAIQCTRVWETVLTGGLIPAHPVP